jgi:hypothetical protein
LYKLGAVVSYKDNKKDFVRKYLNKETENEAGSQVIAHQVKKQEAVPIA